MMPYEASDEATGLPPLLPPEERDTLWALVMNVGQADALSPLDGEPEGCMVLSVRGLANGADGSSDWAQMHVAVPHQMVMELLGEIGKYVVEYGGFDMKEE